MPTRLQRATPRSPLEKNLIAALLALTLSACGGGGGGDSTVSGNTPDNSTDAPSAFDPLPNASEEIPDAVPDAIADVVPDAVPDAPGAAQPDNTALEGSDGPDIENGTQTDTNGSATDNGESPARAETDSNASNGDAGASSGGAPVDEMDSGPGASGAPAEGPSDPDSSPDSGQDSGSVSGAVSCDASAAEIQTRALELINAARAEARVCGNLGDFAAAGELGWDSRLEDASRTHSTDMATADVFSHTGTDGSSAGDRIERANYTWREYAENIAAGQTTVKEAVQGWLDSPGHCRNIMAPGVTDVAVTCVSNDEATYRRYWTNVLADPLSARSRP